jgi:hypothetical protein
MRKTVRRTYMSRGFKNLLVNSKAFSVKCLKGLGHEVRIQVWFDRSWLGESPADIHNIFNGAFIFILDKFLAV